MNIIKFLFTFEFTKKFTFYSKARYGQDGIHGPVGSVLGEAW